MIILKRSSLSKGSRSLEGAAAAKSAAFSLLFRYLITVTNIKGKRISKKNKILELSKLTTGPPEHAAG
jgi:hypothetical protein